MIQLKSHQKKHEFFEAGCIGDSCDSGCDYLCYLEPDNDIKSPEYIIFTFSDTKELSPTYKADFIKLVQSFSMVSYQIGSLIKS